MENQPVEYRIGEILRDHRLQLGLAESCTGGLISHRITNIPGSSDYFQGGVVAYANAVKTGLLNISQATLDQHGAVSRETVLKMARSVRKLLSTDIGVSVSGIAGPGGGTPAKPVGLAWIGLCAADTEQAWSNIWPGDRAAVKSQVAEAALKHLLDYLNRLSVGFESINVLAKFDAQNQIRPVKIIWRDQTYPILSTGRRWADELGQHILVMLPGDHAYELIYTPSGEVWHLRQIGMSSSRT